MGLCNAAIHLFLATTAIVCLPAWCRRNNPLINTTQDSQFHITQFKSQAKQDRFVCNLLYGFLGKNGVGHYLEIGASDPIEINNTYFLEKNLGWTGVSIDIDKNFAPLWKVYRSNHLLIEDATTANYREILSIFPKVIDYLSLDIDNRYVDVLHQIPFDEYTFMIITIEHDFYAHGDLYRVPEREFLSSHGYFRLCSDVANDGNIYEDWWIHPSFFSQEVLDALISLDLDGKEHTELLNKIEGLLYSKCWN